MSWGVRKRYSDFLELDQSLRPKSYPRIDAFKFPGKTVLVDIFRSIDLVNNCRINNEGTKDARRNEFDSYVKVLVRYVKINYTC